ncbi:uncharacterized protein LOC111037193 [Myzus persicae]|uniref:uncharacterized protein LOC111037193 n=1 Tax=Myzus persicae TaxID=13164 RepID=UPI000B93420F|nr:uncharacterized protein LOC111037193 [Myzus persicae]
MHNISDRSNGFAWGNFGSTIVYSCYYSPNCQIWEFTAFLDDLDRSLRLHARQGVILADDFNAKSSIWGSRTNDRRGELLADLIASHDLLVANTGSTHTFGRGNATSVIDVTFYRGVVVSDWSVLDAVSLSDHRYIEFSFYANETDSVLDTPPPEPVAIQHVGWSVKKLNWDALSEFIASNPLVLPELSDPVMRATAAADGINEYLTKACSISMPRRRPGPYNKSPVYWWSEDIAALRRSVFHHRLSYQACLRRYGPDGSHDARIADTMARRSLCLAIRKAKEKSWMDMCSQVDNDPWGMPYRLVMRKLGNKASSLAIKGKELEVAAHLFPDAPVTNWDSEPTPAVYNIFDAFDPDTDDLVFTLPLPEFTTEELFTAIKRLSPGKAGGPSGIDGCQVEAFSSPIKRARP